MERIDGSGHLPHERTTDPVRGTGPSTEASGDREAPKRIQPLAAGLRVAVDPTDLTVPAPRRTVASGSTRWEMP